MIRRFRNSNNDNTLAMKRRKKSCEALIVFQMKLLLIMLSLSVALSALWKNSQSCKEISFIDVQSKTNWKDIKTVFVALKLHNFHVD